MTTKSKKELQDLLQSEKVKTGHAMIRVISGLTRYRIIAILHSEPSGFSVTDLAETLNATPSQVSHQLRILKKYGLVLGHPKGRTIIYQLNKKKVEMFLPCKS